MPEQMLVTVEFRFVTTEDTRAIGDRVREAVRMIVGRDAVEDFKVHALPLTPKKPPPG